jgi:hypothetical protein
MIGLGMSSEKGLAPAVHVQVVALYEQESGLIRHLHIVSTLGGAPPLSDDDAVAEAREQASRRRLDTGALGVALSNDVEHASRPHRIDPKTRAFVPLPDEAGTNAPRSAP